MKKFLETPKGALIVTGALVVLRIAIGWHFLYEGLAKLFVGGWSSYNFLLNARWILSGFFHWRANNPSLLKIVDILNVWGLILIGLGLFFGVFTRVASAAGILLLSFYYIASPPLLGMDVGVPVEGQYLVVNKNLIELMALVLFLVVPSRWVPGLDRLWKLLAERRMNRKPSSVAEPAAGTGGIGRREVIKNLAALPFFGGFVLAALKKKGWMSYEEQFLKDTDAISSATMKSFDFSDLKDLKEKIPSTKIIGGIDISRLILGGNLIGGWAHARELIYVSKMVKYYHTD